MILTLPSRRHTCPLPPSLVDNILSKVFPKQWVNLLIILGMKSLFLKNYVLHFSILNKVTFK